MRIPHTDGLFKGALIAPLLMIFTGPAQAQVSPTVGSNTASDAPAKPASSAAWSKYYGGPRTDASPRTARPNAVVAAATGAVRQAQSRRGGRGCTTPRARRSTAGRRPSDRDRTGRAGIERERPEPARLRAGFRRW